MRRRTPPTRIRTLLALLVLVPVAACGVSGTGTVDVLGHVVDSYGVGIPNIDVAILGFGDDVSEVDGAFSIAGVDTPYRLVAFDAADDWAHLFEGISTAAPEVVPGEAIFGGSILDRSTATLNVTPDVGPGVGEVLVLCVENPSLAMASCEEVSSGDPIPQSLQAGWYGLGAVDATVRGVLFSVGTDDLPDAALRMGTATVNVGDGDTSAVALTTSPVTDVVVTVDMDLPAGYSLDGMGVLLVLPDGNNSLPLPFGSPVGTTATVALPDIAGASVVVVAQATDTDSNAAMAWSDRVPLAATTVSLTVPEVPSLLSPADGATDVGFGTTFEVEDRPGAAFLFVVDPDTGGTGPVLIVSTVEPQIVLPDLTGLDAALDLPSAQPYEWRALVFDGVTNANGLVDDGGVAVGYVALMRAATGGEGPGPTAAGTFLAADERTFTTP